MGRLAVLETLHLVGVGDRSRGQGDAWVSSMCLAVPAADSSSTQEMGQLAVHLTGGCHKGSEGANASK